ncbi:MAG: hypothetical protein ABID64_02925 [Nitrospirota bacterium]
MKKILILLAVPLILTGCFGIGEETPTSELTVGETEYSTSNFSILAPQDWETIEESDFTSSVPAETIVVFRNNVKSEIFTANVNISAAEVNETISSSDLAVSSRTKAKNSLVSFEEISLTNVEVPFGEVFMPGARLVFTGKKSASDPIIYFDQIYVVDGGLGFIVTASSLLEEDETVVNYLDRMLNSFALK